MNQRCNRNVLIDNKNSINSLVPLIGWPFINLEIFRSCKTGIESEFDFPYDMLCIHYYVYINSILQPFIDTT